MIGRIRYAFRAYVVRPFLLLFFAFRRVIFSQKFIENPLDFFFTEIAHMFGQVGNFIENVNRLFLSGGVICAAAAAVGVLFICLRICLHVIYNFIFHGLRSPFCERSDCCVYGISVQENKPVDKAQYFCIHSRGRRTSASRSSRAIGDRDLL